MELYELSLSELSRMLEKGECSSVEITESVLFKPGKTGR